MTSIVMLRVWGSIPIMTGPRVVLILALLRSALMVSIGRHSYFGWHIPLLSLYRSGSVQDRANKMKASPPPEVGSRIGGDGLGHLRLDMAAGSCKRFSR